MFFSFSDFNKCYGWPHFWQNSYLENILFDCMHAAKQFVEQKLGFYLLDFAKQFDFPSFECPGSWEYPH